MRSHAGAWERGKPNLTPAEHNRLREPRNLPPPPTPEDGLTREGGLRGLGCAETLCVKAEGMQGHTRRGSVSSCVPTREHGNEEKKTGGGC